MLLVTKIFERQNIRLNYKLNQLIEKKSVVQKKVNKKRSLFLEFYNLSKKKLMQQV